VLTGRNVGWDQRFVTVKAVEFLNEQKMLVGAIPQKLETGLGVGGQTLISFFFTC